MEWRIALCHISVYTVRTVAIVQCRMDSTRLPGKVMMKIGDHYVIEHVMKRVSAAVPMTIAAIPDTPENNELADLLLDNLMVAVFRGADEDVLDRFYNAARVMKADLIMRVCGDQPFVDPNLISHEDIDGITYASNDPCIHGLNVEVMSMDMLTEAHEQATNPHDREHVTPWMRRHLGLPEKIPHQDGYRWVLDTSKDLLMFRAIASHLDTTPPNHPTVNELLKLLKQRPWISALNLVSPSEPIPSNPSVTTESS